MANADGQQNGEGRMQKVVRSLAKKAIAPIAASLTAYAVKKLPDLLEEKILPKVHERSKALGRNTPSQARTASVDDAHDGAAPIRALSDDEREEARRRREEHRRARRQAAT